MKATSSLLVPFPSGLTSYSGSNTPKSAKMVITMRRMAVCRVDRWKDVSADNPTDAYENWLRLLQNLKDHYSRSPSKVMQKVQGFSGRSDTRSAAEWDFSREHIHLIGIRRGAGKKWKVRINNDVFVLLVNGLTFMFFGSTDPTPQGKRRQRPPFLVPGQHLYRFG